MATKVKNWLNAKFSEFELNTQEILTSLNKVIDIKLNEDGDIIIDKKDEVIIITFNNLITRLEKNIGDVADYIVNQEYLNLTFYIALYVRDVVVIAKALKGDNNVRY